MDAREEQPTNALCSMNVTDLGMLTDAREEQP